MSEFKTTTKMGIPFRIKSKIDNQTYEFESLNIKKTQTVNVQRILSLKSINYLQKTSVKSE